VVANALRANTSLTALSLTAIQLWHDAAELVGALTAHPLLRLLDLSDNPVVLDDGGLQAAEASALLAALLLANAPALQTLDVEWCGLGDEGMGPVMEALRNNTHLTKLNCSYNVSEAFARDVLLPAVRANSSLRELVAAGEAYDAVAAREAEALVAARTQQQPS
jgi:hypothetical protein